jgi:hypothetical protein
MKTHKEQVIQCVEQIVTHRNKAERERYKKLINCVRDKLLDHFKKSEMECGNLLAKLSDIDLIKEREINVRLYDATRSAANAFKTALETLSNVPIFCPAIQETENWDSDICLYVRTVATNFADMARADEKTKAQVRPLAKKSAKRK